MVESMKCTLRRFNHLLKLLLLSFIVIIHLVASVLFVIKNDLANETDTVKELHAMVFLWSSGDFPWYILLESVGSHVVVVHYLTMEEKTYDAGDIISSTLSVMSSGILLILSLLSSFSLKTALAT
jgi:hypothetical protein